MPHIRPQPRKPDFLRTPTHPPCAPPSKPPTLEVAAHIDAVPRVSAPCPPSPPVLYSSRRDVSFTFLPSTCSEESDVIQKSHQLTQHVDHTSQQPPQPTSSQHSSLWPIQQSLDARNSTHQSNLGLPVVQQSLDARSSTHQSNFGLPVVQQSLDARTSTHQSNLGPPVVQQHVDARTPGTAILTRRYTHTHPETRDPQPHSLLPPSAFEKPRAGSGGDVAAHKLPLTSGDRMKEPDSDIPLGLTNPTVQTEIVHMRNELKQYHDLKVRQRYDLTLPVCMC